MIPPVYPRRPRAGSGFHSAEYAPKRASTAPRGQVAHATSEADVVQGGEPFAIAAKFLQIHLGLDHRVFAARVFDHFAPGADDLALAGVFDVRVAAAAV